MAKKVTGFVKLQIPAGQATPAPPVGTALGPQGINIMAFVKEFNSRTAKESGTILPVEITIFADKSFTFITKTPPAAILVKKELGLDKGSGQPNRNKVGSLTRAQVRKIAEIKMPDLNCDSIESAMAMVAGAARSMGARGPALFWKVVVPGASPFIITGLRLAFQRAWIAVVGAEMLAASAFGLGWVIFDAKEFLNADIMLASLIVIGGIGFVFERVVFGSLERSTVLRWGMVRTVKA